MHRRTFLKSAAIAGVAAAANGSFGQASSRGSAGAIAQRAESPEMQYRELGKTGERVSVIGLGGYHIGKQENSNESIRLIRTAADTGITFLDNCWDYNDGLSEVRMDRRCGTAIGRRYF